LRRRHAVAAIASSIHANAFLTPVSWRTSARIRKVAQSIPIVNGCHKPRSCSETRNRRSLWIWCCWVALVAIASVFASVTAAALPPSPQHLKGATIQGRVFDSASNPVGDAAVQLEATGARAPSQTRTNAAGAFEFSALSTGSYTLSAAKAGLRSRATAPLALSDGDRKHIDLVLETSGAAAQPMDFSDTPNFTVAGVTDWTAVGGHGSDSILRTSEDLARETLALKAQSAGQHTAAGMENDSRSESSLRTALATTPGNFAPNHQLGEFYLHAGRYSESLPLLEAAYRIDPVNNENERDLALAYENTGDLKQAREHIANLLKRQNDAELHRMAGELDEKLGEPLAAVQEYQRAASLDPSEQNYFAWGSELLLHRAVWQAAEVFRNGIKAHPQSARLQTALGTALFAVALYDEAARTLCDASDLNPANPEPYIFMGKVEIAAPAPLPCIEPKLARFVQQNPDSSVANYLYAMAIWKRQQSSANKVDSPQIEALLTKAVSLDAKCSDGYLQLGILAASQHNYEKAIPLYTKAIDADPQLGEAHYRLGVAYDRLSERDKAAQEYQLHDEIEKRQAAAIEQERRDVKQFVVVQGQPAKSVTQ
jgi:tetratricopeptide (TPR) repeat protein